jgi:hypothetical protein
MYFFVKFGEEWTVGQKCGWKSGYGLMVISWELTRPEWSDFSPCLYLGG